jgi:hypothetical protein
MIEITWGLQLIYWLGLMSPILFIAGWAKGYKDGHKEGKWSGRYEAQKSLRR